jgi:hypothetical protein
MEIVFQCLMILDLLRILTSSQVSCSALPCLIDWLVGPVHTRGPCRFGDGGGLLLRAIASRIICLRPIHLGPPYLTLHSLVIYTRTSTRC